MNGYFPTANCLKYYCKRLLFSGEQKKKNMKYMIYYAKMRRQEILEVLSDDLSPSRDNTWLKKFHVGSFAQFWPYILKTDHFKLLQKVRKKKHQLLVSPYISEKEKLKDFDFLARMGRAWITLFFVSRWWKVSLLANLRKWVAPYDCKQTVTVFKLEVRKAPGCWKNEALKRAEAGKLNYLVWGLYQWKSCYCMHAWNMAKDRSLHP